MSNETPKEKKAQRAQDAVEATAEYNEKNSAEREKTVRLKALRLEKEAADKAAETGKPKKSATKRKR